MFAVLVESCAPIDCALRVTRQPKGFGKRANVEECARLAAEHAFEIKDLAEDDFGEKRVIRAGCLRRFEDVIRFRPMRHARGAVVQSAVGEKRPIARKTR